MKHSPYQIAQIADAARAMRLIADDPTLTYAQRVAQIREQVSTVVYMTSECAEHLINEMPRDQQ